MNWHKPVHFIWGCSDEVFTEVWGRQWADQMNATFSPIQEASHFLQNTHGKELADILITRISEE
jgi:pimeloyl-ACP methyl ester carboxylesterase